MKGELRDGINRILFHGFITCINCFFRLTCAKKKIEPDALSKEAT